MPDPELEIMILCKSKACRIKGTCERYIDHHGPDYIFHKVMDYHKPKKQQRLCPEYICIGFNHD